MRWIGPAAILALAFGSAVLAQTQSQAPLRNTGSLKLVRAPTAVESAQLRLALQKAQTTRQELNAVRAQLRLPPLDLAAINRTKVPVLTVSRGAQFADIRIHTSTDHMTVTGGNAVRGFVITGTRLAQTAGKPLAPRLLRPADDVLLRKVLAARSVSDPISDVDVSRTEDGYDISFRRYGVLYNLRMACADTDAQTCTKEEALKLLADTQVLGGGQ